MLFPLHHEWTYHWIKSEILLTKRVVNGYVESLKRLLLDVIHLRIYSRHAKIVGKFSHLRLPPETCHSNWRDGARRFTLPLIYISARLFTGLSFSPKGTHFPEVDELARITPGLLRMVLLTTSVHVSYILVLLCMKREKSKMSENSQSQNTQDMGFITIWTL